MDDFKFTIENDVLKGDEVSYPNDYTSLGKFVLDRLETNPDLVGQIDSATEEAYTYKKIRERSVRCALWMEAHGVLPGDVVAIWSHNQLDVTMPCFAALYLGAALNTLDPGMNRKESCHMLRITKPKMAFVSAELATAIADAAKDAELDLKIIVFGQVANFLEFENVIAQPGTREVENFKCRSIKDPNATAFILCTSGTTGAPKGVALGHQAFLRQMHQSESLGMLGNICVIFTSLSWITGIFCVFMCLLLNAPRIIMPPFEEYSVSALIEKYKVSWILVAPNMINRLLSSGALNKYDFSCMKRVLCVGSALPYASREAFAKFVPNARIITGYGATEVGSVVATQTAKSKHGTCGQLLENCQLKVIDPDTGRIMGIDQKGELVLKTSTMMNCYHRNPEATAQAIDEEGWFHSGDLGYYDKDGQIFIVDRLKELIKYRGYHISPSDIESLIMSHPGVKDVAVVGRPHPQDDEHPVAFVVRTTDAGTTDKRVTEVELVKLVASEMSETKQLRGGIQFVECIPRTPSGKIQRKQLRDLAMSTIAA